MSDKPLHVRVAEALGCDARLFDERYRHGWFCLCGRSEHADGYDGKILDYDTDWSATGPLIEKYRLDITTSATDWIATAWRPDASPERAYRERGATPLIAVCNLIIVLHEAGKLNS